MHQASVSIYHFPANCDSASSVVAVCSHRTVVPSRSGQRARSRNAHPDLPPKAAIRSQKDCPCWDAATAGSIVTKQFCKLVQMKNTSSEMLACWHPSIEAKRRIQSVSTMWCACLLTERQQFNVSSSLLLRLLLTMRRNDDVD